MTHTPSLPNGFSRDFSEAPEDAEVFVWLRLRRDLPKKYFAVIGIVRGDRILWENGAMPLADALCWCPIPTPGDDVLKELAEKANG